MIDMFQPWRMGPIELRNRVIKAATNEGMAKGGVPSRLLVEHHQRIAAGGAALTTVAYCAVSPDGRTFEDQLVLNAGNLRHLRALTDAVHRENGAVSAQITHGGAFCFLPRLSTRCAMSSSSGFYPPGVIAGRPFKRAMTEADLAQVSTEFAAGARLARDAGFDAVEIHMGHGYLLSQFISPAYNKRRDQWGGPSADDRVRFPVRVLSDVLDAVGRDVAVICKIGVHEGFKGGGTAEDAVLVAKALERAGAHLLVLSGGMNAEAPWAIFGSNMPSEVAPEGGAMFRFSNRLMKLWEPEVPFLESYLRPHSLKVRAGVHMPLAYLGGIRSLEGIRQAAADGFEAVVMGRALIHNPDFVRELEQGLAAVSGCTSCNRCIPKMYSAGGTRCVLMPESRLELNAVPADAKA
ncbi:NADH:flavin oxidoreductase [Nevskia soli]|uniref:NADH:flavin oxidoreductase n=1 Tax=Nevskia soli TaxID=418856 RepID=UPI0004A7551B|nr:NADH:flavin oxidoreductase [Nevskia soli]